MGASKQKQKSKSEKPKGAGHRANTKKPIPFYSLSTHRVLPVALVGEMNYLKVNNEGTPDQMFDAIDAFEDKHPHVIDVIRGCFEFTIHSPSDAHVPTGF